MKILLYSKCIEQLNFEKAKTSSELFELQFMFSLISFVSNITIISEKALKQEVFSNVIFLYPIETKGKFNYGLKKIIKTTQFTNDNEKRIIIIFGYDLINIIQFKSLQKVFSAKLISYTFDTHKATLNNKSLLKRILIDIYFSLGRIFLTKIDGILLLKQEAYELLKLTIPYHISKIGVFENEINTYSILEKTDNRFHILYAGSLEVYNGIDALLEVGKFMNELDVFFHIYGNGSLVNKVQDYSNKYRNILYGGSVNQEEMRALYSKSDLLLNLRVPNGYVNKFAFPSKVIKYMASGVPLLSTNDLDDIEFEKAVFIVNDLTVKGISDAIKHIIDNPVLCNEKASFAKNYIRENHTWDRIIKEIYDFFIVVLQK